MLTRVDDASRGQVLAALNGAARAFSLGALALGGVAASSLGPRGTFVASGALALLVTVWFAVRVLGAHASASQPAEAAPMSTAS